MKCDLSRDQAPLSYLSDRIPFPLPIGSVRCIIIPIDCDCALGFRCVEFTSCSMADEQFASSICSQLKIELAHTGDKTPGRKCELLHILYDE